MGAYLARRAAAMMVVLLGVTVITYGMLELAPGDPVTALLNPELIATLGPEWVEGRKAELGLDKPLPIRYLTWLREAATGNLGYSSVNSLPVTRRIGERLWPTLQLMLTGQVIAIVLGVSIGILSATKQYSLIDHGTTVLALTVLSVPAFYLALIGIYVLGLKLGWLPLVGMGTLGGEREGVSAIVDRLRHLLLPAAILGISHAASLIRYTRSSMLEVINEDYVRVAKAKGLPERLVTLRHALPNALIPVITVIGLRLPTLVSGTIVLEQVFAWPGMGRLAITAINQRDYPVVMGFNLVTAVVIVVASLVADVAYAAVDPRVRYD